MRFASILLGVIGSVAAFAAGPADYARALNLYNHTEYTAAVEALKGSTDARSLVLIGRASMMSADYAKATEALEKAVALEPDDSMTVLWLGRAYGRRAENSFPLAAMGWATKARKAMERAYQLDPLNRDAQDDLFDFYLQAPGVMGGGLDKARTLIPVIAKRDQAEADLDTARIAEATKQFDSAEAHLRRALLLAPQQVGRVLDLARFLSKQGRYSESDAEFDKAARMAPDAPKVLYARAESYVQSKRNLDRARVLLNKYLAAANRTPEDPSPSEARRLLKRIEGA